MRGSHLTSFSPSGEGLTPNRKREVRLPTRDTKVRKCNGDYTKTGARAAVISAISTQADAGGLADLFGYIPDERDAAALYTALDEVMEWLWQFFPMDDTTPRLRAYSKVEDGAEPLYGKKG